MGDLNFVVVGSCLHHLIVHRSEPSSGSAIEGMSSNRPTSFRPRPALLLAS
jgi:hypothetical protein